MLDALVFAVEVAARAGISLESVSDPSLGEFPIPDHSPLAQGIPPRTTPHDGYDTVRGCLGSIYGASQQDPESVNAVLEDCDYPNLKLFVIAAIELIIESPQRFDVMPAGVEALTQLLTDVRAVTPTMDL